jgi:hypothetical protein
MPMAKEDHCRERFLNAGEMVRRLEQSRFATFFKGDSEEINTWNRQMRTWMHDQEWIEPHCPWPSVKLIK